MMQILSRRKRGSSRLTSGEKTCEYEYIYISMCSGSIVAVWLLIWFLWHGKRSLFSVLRLALGLASCICSKKVFYLAILLVLIIKVSLSFLFYVMRIV